MSKLEKLIDRIVEFGTRPNVVSDNKTDEIQKLLVAIYAEYLNLDAEIDMVVYDEAPNFDYKTIKKNVEKNFPEFGCYHSVWESHKIIPDAAVNTGDAIDDITDILKDLLSVKWRIENTSEKDAHWYFKDLMRIHSEQHLVNFLKYLKDRNG